MKMQSKYINFILCISAWLLTDILHLRHACALTAQTDLCVQPDMYAYFQMHTLCIMHIFLDSLSSGLHCMIMIALSSLTTNKTEETDRNLTMVTGYKRNFSVLQL